MGKIAPMQTLGEASLGKSVLVRLTSRKFWAVVAAFIVPAIQDLPERWRAVIIAVATPLYIISEAVIDARRAGAPILVPDPADPAGPPIVEGLKSIQEVLERIEAGPRKKAASGRR